MLLIAGDLFHRQPLLRELKEVNYLFAQIPETQVFLMAGNHDYLKLDSYYRTFSWTENVHMFKGKEVSCVEVPELELAVYGCSYFAKEITEPIYDTTLPQKRQKYEILLAHGGDEKHVPLKRNKIASLGYDYVALGHIHKHQELIPQKAVYPGALEPIDKNDTGKHGYIEGEIRAGGTRNVFVPCAAREYIHQDIEVRQEMTGFGLKNFIAETIAQAGTQNIFKLTLTGLRDPEIEFDLSNMDKYGNIIEIIDSTSPAYDFQKLYEQNADNIIGKYIESFKESDKNSAEFSALCEGIQALMQTRRGWL